MAVYFIKDATSDLMKIGHSASPWSRLSKMQSDSSGELHLMSLVPGGVDVEGQLHARFADLRVRGEWFQFRAPLTDYVATLPPAERPRRRNRPTVFYNGMTVQQVSAATGIAEIMLYQIGQGRRRGSVELAMKIQRATGVSAVRLIFREHADEAAAGLTSNVEIAA